MNNIIAAPEQTPIEILLQVDENGMTTAKKLYEFLELNPLNYSRWCKVNISNNQFAVKDRDYEVFVSKEENPASGGRPTKDYKLTADFAKKLAMSSGSPKGEEARRYFVAVEDKLKQAVTVAVQPAAMPFEAIKAMLTYVETHENKINDHDERLAALENSRVEEVIIEEEPEPSADKNLSIVLGSLGIRDGVLYTATDIGRVFGIASPVRFNEFLARLGIIEGAGLGAGSGWKIARKYSSLGYTYEKETNSKTRGKCIILHWTERGAEFVIGRLKHGGLVQREPLTHRLSRNHKKK